MAQNEQTTQEHSISHHRIIHRVAQKVAQVKITISMATTQDRMKQISPKMFLDPQRQGARLRGIHTHTHTRTHARTHAHKHTHTHTFNGPLSGTTQVSRYQKGKTNLDFTEARDSEWQWHQLGHMQVCTSLQTDNHASTPPLSFLQAGCPSAAQTTAS